LPSTSGSTGFVGLDRVLALGLLPFVPGDLLKLGLAGAVLPGTWGILSRFFPENSGLNRRNPGRV